MGVVGELGCLLEKSRNKQHIWTHQQFMENLAPKTDPVAEGKLQVIPENSSKIFTYPTSRSPPEVKYQHNVFISITMDAISVLSDVGNSFL